ncbi:uncharacterized protein LOC116851228 isoform X3 [Odontomachus brunneus]|uniref:uncharacterized protein LOC116851228 isoform X3 n=1 Tax=Odontomachus brunneus TaxID=486640 RepID=UPI0013F27174|nr:uncharacterized protein LOC116851228 isoform X3 [Odontomachus brunneus]
MDKMIRKRHSQFYSKTHFHRLVQKNVSSSMIRIYERLRQQPNTDHEETSSTVLQPSNNTTANIIPQDYLYDCVDDKQLHTIHVFNDISHRYNENRSRRFENDISNCAGTSSGKNIWPILCSDTDSRDVHIIGIYYGERKPNNANDFLQMFVDEAITVVQNSVEYKHKQYKIDYLKTLGGRDDHDRVKKIMKKIITNEFAMGFNFTGFKNKKSFEELQIAQCIIHIITTTTKNNTTTKEISEWISKWLAGAKQRFDREI